jgi:hypothetical protein
MKAVPPLVSIGLPTYNRAASLGKAVDSVLAQTHRDVELIASDNASTDRTEDLCRDRAARDGRLRYIRQAVNRGPTANFGAVLEAARGEYFMWLSDDDWLDANYVAACLEALAARPGITLAGGRCRHYDASGRFLTEDVATNITQAGAADRLIAYFADVNYNSIFYGLMPTSLVRQHGMRNALAADWMVVAGMLVHGHAVTVEQTRVHRTVGGTSKSVRNIARVLGLPLRHWIAPEFAIAFNSARGVLELPWPAHVSDETRRETARRVRDILLVRRTKVRRFIPKALKQAILRRLSAPLPATA